jgi:Ca2+-binding EF-hand superfamily protein
MAPVLWEKKYVIEEMISTMCHISCSGLLKNSEAVDEVLRKQKSKRAVRAIMIMTSLNKKNQETTSFDDQSVKNKRQVSDLPTSELQEIASVFDMYDQDGSGEIDNSELGNVMSSLGFNLSGTEKEKMFATLDADNDGSVSRNEFLEWYASNSGGNKENNMRQMAQELFTVFDKDGSGSIDMAELIQCLQGLNHGLSFEEIVQLAKELDENGDGEISMEEFEAIINEE